MQHYELWVFISNNNLDIFGTFYYKFGLQFQLLCLSLILLLHALLFTFCRSTSEPSFCSSTCFTFTFCKSTFKPSFCSSTCFFFTFCKSTSQLNFCSCTCSTFTFCRSTSKPNLCSSTCSTFYLKRICYK